MDKFLTYQNGNLLSIFYKDKKIDIKKYEQSNIYKNIDLTNENQINFFNKAIKAYENFIDFLESDNVVINYKYLWDIVTTPNEKLFPNGMNLVILEMSNSDLTDNVKVICPSNHYSKEFFDINKKTLILIKNENFYEPIYAFEDKQQKF